MKLVIVKKVDDNTTLFKYTGTSENKYVLTKKTGETREGFWYDVTIFWADIDKCSKVEFSQAPHKTDFLNNPSALEDALSDNVLKFPCNAEMGMKHGVATNDEKKLLGLLETKN